MSKKGRSLSEEERKLWRRVALHVKPRRAGASLPPEEDPAPLPAARPVPRRTSAFAAAAKRAIEPLPQDRGSEKRVRRGKLEIGGTLDLHGHTQETGYGALVRFLRAAQRRGARTVIVVTGVGRGGEGVLKRRLPDWLAERAVRPLVSGFAQAHRAHGGAGAFYVFLKRLPETHD